MSETQRSRRNVVRGTAAAIFGFVSVFIAMALVPPTVGKVGPARLSVSADNGGGHTSVALPPFGTVVAQTHKSPLDFNLSVVEVDFERLGPLATSPQGRETLRGQVEHDLKGLLIKSIAIEVVGAFAISLILTAAFFRHSKIALVAGGTGSAIAILLIGGVSVWTFNVDGFQEPRFTGSLSKAREVVSAVQRGEELLDKARSRFDIASGRVADLITLLSNENTDPLQQETAILHVSDIHANPLGLELVDQLANEFDVDAIIDTGDLGSAALDTGEISELAGPVDGLLTKAVQDLDVPYYFVPGNHDSPGLIDRLEGADGVTVFSDEVENIEGLQVLGWADPTFSTRPIPIDEKDQERLDVGETTVAPEVLSVQPDILAVHDARLGEASIGTVPIMLSGHLHERLTEQRDGTLLLQVGSTGATGLNSLTVEADMSYEAEILYFSGTQLTALDYISLRGVGGDFELERRTFPVPEN
jgi:predicted phosphodiesterase